MNALPAKVKSNPTLHREVLSWMIDWDFNGTDYGDRLVSYTPDKLTDIWDEWVEENAAENYDWEMFALVSTKGIRAQIDMDFISDRLNDCAWVAWVDCMFGPDRAWDDNEDYYEELFKFKRVEA
jgi:hypothetical protein